MAILRYLTKLTGLQAGDEPEVHEIPLESSEPTNVGQLTARLSRALKARLTETMKQEGFDDIDSAHGDILNVLYRQGPTSMTTWLVARIARKQPSPCWSRNSKVLVMSCVAPIRLMAVPVWLIWLIKGTLVGRNLRPFPSAWIKLSGVLCRLMR